MFLKRVISLQKCKASQRVNACSQSAAELKSAEIPGIESNKKTISLCKFSINYATL